MQSGLPEGRIFSLDAVELCIDAADHPWRIAEAAAIEAHWAREQLERPWLFNGTVLMHRGLHLHDGVISGTSHRVPFAALLHWIKTNPRADVWHLFGSGLILTCDGALLLIRMAARTANPGKVYAPSGSLDESDIEDGRINVEGSILREVMEETGCDLTRSRSEQQLWGWRQGGRVAIFRRFELDEPASVVVERMRQHIRTDPEQEIDDVVVVRAPGDAGSNVPAHMQAMIDFHFARPEFDTRAGGMG